MKFTLTRHSLDSNMIEAVLYTGDMTLLAFIIHEDCFENAEAKEILDELGSVTVEMVVCPE